jgi:hypothetical protein
MNFYQLHTLIESEVNQNEGFRSWISNFGHGRPQSYSQNKNISDSKAKFVSDNAGTFGQEQPIIQWVKSIEDQYWPLADCLARQWGIQYFKTITDHIENVKQGKPANSTTFAMRCQQLAPQVQQARTA